MEHLATKKVLKEINDAVGRADVHIHRSDETPEVIMSTSEGMIKYSGRSMPEDAKSFYLPLKEWILKYAENPTPGTQVIFEYEYFNTSSSKMIMEIIEATNKIGAKDKNFKVEWRYMEDDDDILEAGEEYEEITGITFEFVSYD
ncbi:MAG: DUF1987 domain-containing protein [Bacteroidales bacterium]